MRCPPATRRILVVACLLAFDATFGAGRAEAVRYKLAGTLDGGASDSSFGFAMAEGGGRIFVAAPFEPGATPQTFPGAVYVFDVHTGALIRKLTSPVAGGAAFGAALALVGDVLAVGEPAGTRFPGSAQEFVHLFDAASGELIRSIANPSGDPTRVGFGSVLVPFDGGARLAVAAPSSFTVNVPASDVFAFEFPSGDPAPGWVQPSENTSNQGFGHALAAVGGLMVAGNPFQRPDFDVAGVAFVYDAATGAFLRTLDNPAPLSTAEFGWAMAPAGDAVAISAPVFFQASPPLSEVFVIDPATGTLQQTLSAPDPTPVDMNFGQSLAAVGDLVLVGGTSRSAGKRAGIFLFDPVSGEDVWDYVTHTIQDFGEHVASDGRDLLINGTVGDQGTVFHFVPTCGDGVLDPCETCDDGNNVSGDGCSADCVLETCGNGVVDPGEQCDDGNDVDGDGCDRGCLATGCGNCIVDPGEECDDGNDAIEDHCDPNCALPRCGNGFVGFGETCDDGNTLGGDGCSATCQPEACGNGVVDAGESCDDGNLVSGDGCDAHCRLETARLGWWKQTFAFPDVTKALLLTEPVFTAAGPVVIVEVDFGDGSNAAQLYDRETGALLHTFPETNPYSVRGFAGDVWVSNYGTPNVVNRYDGATLALRQSYVLPLPQSFLNAFNGTFALVGNYVLTGGAEQQTVDVFDAASGDFLRALAPPAGVSDDAFGAEIVGVGRHVAITGTGVVYLFDPTTGTLVQTLNGGALNTFDAAGPVALDGDVLLHAPGVVNLFDGADGTLLHTFMPPGAPDASFGRYVAIIPGALLISGADAVHVFDPTTHAFVRTLRNPRADGGCFGNSIVDTPFGVAISNLCAGEDLDGIVHVFDHDTGRVVAVLPNERGGDSESQTHALFADGTTLFLWHQDDEDGSFAVARAWIPCADGVLEPGEECDDGNLASGDGCDLSCTLTRCGNGIVTAGEECDDGNRASGDGCENNCTVTRDVCPAPLTLQGTELALRHLGAPAGNETLTLSGALVPPPGTKLDPRDAANYGAQVRVLDANGTALLDLSLATAVIPPGNRGAACGRGDGWRSGKGRVVYTNGSGALDAQCTPDSAQGLKRLEITRRAADGGLAFRLRVGPSPIPDPSGTLRIAIAFGGAAGPSATCGARTFDDVACERSMRGTTIECH